MTIIRGIHIRISLFMAFDVSSMFDCKKIAILKTSLRTRSVRLKIVSQNELIVCTEIVCSVIVYDTLRTRIQNHTDCADFIIATFTVIRTLIF